MFMIALVIMWLSGSFLLALCVGWYIRGDNQRKDR